MIHLSIFSIHTNCLHYYNVKSINNHSENKNKNNHNHNENENENENENKSIVQKFYEH